MEQRNAYFQLDVQENGTFIKLFPPKAGGEALKVREVSRYLESKGLQEFDLKELDRRLVMAEPSKLCVGQSDGIEINEKMDIDVSVDKMTATCRFYPPSAGGQKMDAQEILEELQSAGIRVGIIKEEIVRFVKKRLYCTDYIMAKGKLPVQGKDASIAYFFNTDVTLRPKRNEDGTVDYHELGNISHVQAGELLARLTKEDLGKSGADVFGQEVKPHTVKTMKLLYANNITLSEDGTELYSQVTGHASLVNGKVFVSNIYEVPADVDNSVGNINYDGNVYIRGNVKGGFVVSANGDIIVDGVVEDAVLRAGGQIIVKRGIHGMSKGSLRAYGNIVCKFIENATVESGGYIETDTILHSRVSAGTQIRVGGKKGLITGGTVRAGGLIEAMTIGSALGSSTNIEVGTDPAKKERYLEVQEHLEKNKKEMGQIRPILKTYSKRIAAGEKLGADDLRYVQQLAAKLQSKQTEYDKFQAEFKRLHMAVSQSGDARVKVRRTLYPGVVISISDVSLSVRDERSFCQLLKRQGEIVIETL